MAKLFASRWTRLACLCGGAALAGGPVAWTATSARPIDHGAGVAVGVVALAAITLTARRMARRRAGPLDRLAIDATTAPIYMAYSTLAAGRTSLVDLEEGIVAARKSGTKWSAGLIDLLDDVLARRTAI